MNLYGILAPNFEQVPKQDGQIRFSIADSFWDFSDWELDQEVPEKVGEIICYLSKTASL